MSTERSPSDGTPAVDPPPPWQSLPSDLLLEIAARSDAATVLYCAATSKPLRSAILDPVFRRLLALRSAANGGFDPALLLGVSYRLDGAVAVTSPHLRLDAGIFLDSEWLPESSPDGLLLLRRDVHEERVTRLRYGVYLTSRLNLCVCDTFAGHVVASLPQPALKYCSGHNIKTKDYAALLTTAGDVGFETVSSKSGEWGAARAVHPAPAHPWIFGRRLMPCAAAAVGRTVHWLCFRRPEAYTLGDRIVLALHADTARATKVELPQACLSRIGDDPCDARYYERDRRLLLHAAGDGRRLGMVAAELDAITVWTLSVEGSRWSRRAVVGREAIARQLPAAGWDVVHGTITLEGIGERSGTVLFSTKKFGGLAQLNLVTKKALKFRRCRDCKPRTWSQCVHDIDLGSLLQRMKHF
uniref:Uncharacterized protein n=1 Tax=Setaria viridis TaxID=4556 RepID=A0A4U6UZQ5_SETVI|nr:hypothetical protein SEVIR_4G197600v2 [Setaria viridis]